MSKQGQNSVAIVGTVGVPGNYGGFETLAENLVRYHHHTGRQDRLTVYCSSRNYPKKSTRYLNAELQYLKLSANGVWSILYDAVSLWDAVRRGHDRIVLLGVAGALFLPLIRLVGDVRIVTNIDGIEWKRAKWNRAARAFLRASERAAVRFSHAVIADNQAIADHVRESYGQDCHVIAYGGDHALDAAEKSKARAGLPDDYALALCRIEPENNVHTILEAWTQVEIPLVFVGNWTNSPYGRELKIRFASTPNIHLLDPIYEPGALHAIRAKASLYVHGHSAGGTNPSLVEMMHFGIPILAHGCTFNRHSTEDKARYFETSRDLVHEVRALALADIGALGADMREIARRRYTWEIIGEAYFTLFEQV